jgi:hypothetical protein
MADGMNLHEQDSAPWKIILTAAGKIPPQSTHRRIACDCRQGEGSQQFTGSAFVSRRYILPNHRDPPPSYPRFPAFNVPYFQCSTRNILVVTLIIGSIRNIVSPTWSMIPFSTCHATPERSRVLARIAICQPHGPAGEV